MFRDKYGDIFEQLNLRQSVIQDMLPKIANRTLDPTKLFGKF